MGATVMSESPTTREAVTQLRTDNASAPAAGLEAQTSMPALTVGEIVPRLSVIGTRAMERLPTARYATVAELRRGSRATLGVNINMGVIWSRRER